MEVRGAVVYASLIVVAVLLPVLSMSGIAGRIISPLAEAYMLAVAASLLVALTLTPALSAWLLTDYDGLERPERRVIVALRRAYDRLLASTRRRPGRVLLVSSVLGLLGVVLLPFVGGSFLPEFREGVLIAEVEAWPGSSLEETTRLMRRLSERLRSPGGVLHAAARVGRATLDEDAAPARRAELDLVSPPDAGEPEEVARPLLARMAELPGVRFSLDGFLGERINELLSGERAPIAVKFIGDDLAALRHSASRLMTSLRDVPDLRGVRSVNLVHVPTTDVRLLSAQMAIAGVDRARVAEAVAASAQGLELGLVRAPRGYVAPLAASLDAAGSELEAPMALIVCCGLLSSTALNLWAVPAFYLWWARRPGAPGMNLSLASAIASRLCTVLFGCASSPPPVPAANHRRPTRDHA